MIEGLKNVNLTIRVRHAKNLLSFLNEMPCLNTKRAASLQLIRGQLIRRIARKEKLLKERPPTKL
ncbi:MAG: hypothetical protein WCS42_21330 [Verrucomicrobiota bacterium]